MTALGIILIIFGLIGGCVVATLSGGLRGLSPDLVVAACCLAGGFALVILGGRKAGGTGGGG